MPSTAPARRRTHARRGAAAALVALSTAALTGCVANEPDDEQSGRATVTVESSADACELSTTTVPAGTVVFTVTNTGDEPTEFYLLEEDGVAIVSEVENIGPGVTRDMVVSAEAGSYLTACKPGMTGDGIRADFTVT